MLFMTAIGDAEVQQQRLSIGILTTSSGAKYSWIKGLPESSFSYQSMQKILVIPACFIILAQEKQGKQVVQSRQPGVLLIPTSIRADSQACRHKHWSSCFPSFMLHRSQPSLQHDCSPFGVPLYPVETTRLSLFTITAPTEVFIQFDLLLAMSAIFMKYWSQVGRKNRTISLSFLSTSSRIPSRDPLFQIRILTYSRHASYSLSCHCSSISIKALTWLWESSNPFAFKQQLYLVRKGASTSTILAQFRFFSYRRAPELCPWLTITAFGVSEQVPKQISLKNFSIEMLAGLSSRLARKTAQPQRSLSSQATSSRPEQGRPMRTILSISSSGVVSLFINNQC